MRCQKVTDLNISNQNASQVPVEVSIHPRNLNLVFIGYTGLDLPYQQNFAYSLLSFSKLFFIRRCDFIRPGDVAFLQKLTWLLTRILVTTQDFEGV